MWWRASALWVPLLFASTFSLVSSFIDRPWIDSGALPTPGKVRLREWLRGVSVHVPGFEVPTGFLENLGLHLTVRRAKCGNIFFGNLDVPSASSSPEAMRFVAHISDFGAHCDVDLVVKTLLGESGLVNASFTLTDAEIEVPFAISSDGLLPSAVSVEKDCSCKASVADMSFSGGALAHLLEVSELAIREAVHTFAGTACVFLRETVAGPVNEALTNLIANLKNYMVPARPRKFPPASSAVVDLEALLWDGPLGHGIRSFLIDTARIQDMAFFNAWMLEVAKGTLKEVQAPQLMSANGTIHLRPGREPWKSTVPLPLTNGSVSIVVDVSRLDLESWTSVSDLSARVWADSAEASGAFVPGASAAAVVDFLLPNGTASVTLGNWTIQVMETEQLASFPLVGAGRAALGGSISGIARFDPDKVQQYALDQMQHVGCMPQMMTDRDPVGLRNVSVQFEPLAASVQLPNVAEGELEAQLLEAAIRIVTVANATFGAALPHLVNGLASSIGRDTVNNVTQQFMEDPWLPCPASNLTLGEIEAVDYPARWAAGIFCSLAVVFALIAVWRCCRLPRDDGTSPDARAVSFTATPWPSNFKTVALCKHPSVPRPLHFAMVFGILGTTMCFLVSAMTPGISVTAFARGGDGSIFESPSIALLSMNNSTFQSWQSGAYAIAIAVIVFSIIWPYMKLCIMLYLWLVPHRPTARGKMLFFLDQVGKWSLVDNFVLTLLVVFFYVHWSGADVLSDGEALLKLRCVPMLEFKLFYLATIAGLVLGHSMLAVHRVTQGHFAVGAQDGQDKLDPAWKFLFPGASPQANKVVGVCGLLLVFFAIVLFIAAWCVPIVDMELDGVVGVFLDVTGQERMTRFSLAGICVRLASLELQWVAAVLTLFVGVIPLLCTLSLALLWILPLSRRRRFMLLTVTQSLNAWSSIDCFAVALFAAVVGGTDYGISKFVDLVIYGGTVAPLCGSLRDNIGLKCLGVKLVFAPTCFVLFVAVAVLIVAWAVVFRAVYKMEAAIEASCCSPERASELGQSSTTDVT